MYLFWISIKKEFIQLSRDRVGLLLMFVMPVLLAVVMTALQNSVYRMVNENRINMLVCNNDTSGQTLTFVGALKNSGMFSIQVAKDKSTAETEKIAEENDALVILTIPQGYFYNLQKQVAQRSAIAMQGFGLKEQDSAVITFDSMQLQLMFNPVLQETYRYSIKASVNGVMQVMQNRMMIDQLYRSINGEEIPQDVAQKLMPDAVSINESTLHAGSIPNPNSTQHNIPAWTLFAMFFSVISLGSNMVREKVSGSFLRLKIMPSSLSVLILSKQVLFLAVTLFQTVLIFSIGRWVFPLLNLPALNLPSSYLALFVVSFISGWCAISYALCVGIIAQTQEQANGFGAASIIILAALGGIFVPGFAMPELFKQVSYISPFKWALDGFYNVFLLNHSLSKIFLNILPLLALIIILQIIIYLTLKRKNLI